MSASFSNELFDKMPVVGIMRAVPEEHLETIAETYSQSGLTCLEVTMNSVNAQRSIANLVRLYGDKLNIGAGTVCSMHDLEKALYAGAQFIVTPILNPDVIAACVTAKIPIFPGAFTPSEIYKAWALGAFMVKLFPAGEMSPQYIKEILAPLNFIRVMPTGGITLNNFTAYLANGASGVGVGSHLFPKDIIKRQDWPALANVYQAFVKKYREFVNR